MKKTRVKYSSFKFTALKYRGSVIKHVLPKVIFFIIWTTFWVIINRYVIRCYIEDSLIGLTTLVLSLLLVFRTNTAYDRYWEGRRLWSNMTVAIRALTRNIWVHVHEKSEYDRKAKEKALDLLIAFPIAVKHYLRGEYSTEYLDICHLISHIPRYSVPSSIQPIVQDLPDVIPNQDTPLEYIKDQESPHPTNLPIEIAFCISTFVAEYAGKDQLAPPVNSVMIANINSLIDSLSGFERILRTPIPIAYSVHLSQITWLFCLTLPFQLLTKHYKGIESQYKDFLVIVIVAITVFTAFGIINIGEEIENPFGYDDNDLPLEEYCEILEKEIKAISSKAPPVHNIFELKPENRQKPTGVPADASPGSGSDAAVGGVASDGD